MTDEMRFLCSDILRYYGEEHQQEKSIEEMAELDTHAMEKNPEKLADKFIDTLKILKFIKENQREMSKVAFIFTDRS